MSYKERLSDIDRDASRSFTAHFVDAFVFFLKTGRPPRSTRVRSSAASDVYKRQPQHVAGAQWVAGNGRGDAAVVDVVLELSLIHISEPTRLLSISYAVFCLKK